MKKFIVDKPTATEVFFQKYFLFFVRVNTVSIATNHYILYYFKLLKYLRN